MLCKNVRVNTERFSQQSVAIGRRIRAARERHDWTMTELAKRAGVNHSYVSKVEIGAFGTPSVEKLSAIAAALGMRLADLTGESEPLDEGVPLVRVSRLLGHASIAVTSAFYERTIGNRAGRVERLADELDAAHERAVRAARNEAPAPLPGTQTDDQVSR